MASIEASMTSLSQELEQRNREIDRLRQKLEEKTELVRNLTCAKRALGEEVECLKTSLKERQEENERLEKELKDARETCIARGLRISALDQENERQARRYSKLRESKAVQELAVQRQDPPARQRSAPTPILSASPRPSDPEFSQEREEKFKSCTKLHLKEFMKLTDFISLIPHLYDYQLITLDEYNKLNAATGFNCTNEDKARFFYMNVLDTKGRKAYTLLHHCLKLEKNHLGHGDLVELLDGADTQQIGEQEGH